MLKDADYWREKYRTNTAEYVNRYFAFALAHEQVTITDFDVLEPEVDNLVKVMERLSEWEEWESVCKWMWFLDSNAGGFLRTRGHWKPLRICLDHAIHATKMLGNARDEAALSGDLALLLMQTCDMSIAKQEYLRLLPIFEQLGKKREMAVAYHNLGILASIAREYAEALSYLEQSLAIKREVSDEKGIANSLHELGNVAIKKKDYPAARNYYKQRLTISEKLGDQDGIAAGFGQLAMLARIEGNLVEAERLYKQALAIKQAFGNVLGIAIYKYNLAVLYVAQGRLEDALPLLEDSVKKLEHLEHYEAPTARKKLTLVQRMLQAKQAIQGFIQKIKFLWRR